MEFGSHSYVGSLKEKGLASDKDTRLVKREGPLHFEAKKAIAAL